MRHACAGRAVSLQEIRDPNSAMLSNSPMTDSEQRDDTELLHRALRIFERVIEHEGADRQRCLDEACGESNPLRDAVSELLRFHTESGGNGRDTLAMRSAIDVDHPSTGLAAGAQLGDYRILERADSGGMGVVYRAEQSDPRRIVALKVMRAELGDSDHRERFRRETALLAELQHPGIACLFDSGTVDLDWGEAPYFAMEFIHGTAIDDFVRSRDLDVPGICDLVIQVCQAIQHAHEHGIVHRDLKPANILVVELPGGRFQPKVLDFGIALRTDVDATRNTLTGQLLGTLSYMSPERANGDGDADHRADVYAIGVILYELLTGCLPLVLSDRSIADVARTLADEEPTRLGSHDPKFRGDLETIVQKSLAKDPDHRYPTAASVADDLQRFLDHEPIHARPISTWYFARKVVRRHRVLVGGVFATLVALAAGLIAALILADHNAELATLERTQREAATRSRDDLRQTLYRAEMRFVSTALANPRARARAKALLSKWTSNDSDLADLRGFEWHVMQRLAHTEALAVRPCRDAEMHWTEAGIQFVHGSDWVTVDPATGETTRQARLGVGMPYNCRVAADRDRAVAPSGNRVLIFSLSSGDILATLPKVSANDTRISPDGRYVACAGQSSGSNSIVIYDLVGEPRLAATVPCTFGSRAFEFSPQSRFYAEAQVRGRLRVHPLDDIESFRNVKIRRETSPHSLQWSRDERRVAIGYDNGLIDLVDLESAEVVQTLEGHDRRVRAVAFDGSGTRLASAGEDSTIRLWEWERGAGRTLGAHDGECLRVVWSPDDAFVASNGFDETLRIFDAQRERAIRSVRALEDLDARGIAWSHDGALLLVDHEAGTLPIDAASETPQPAINGRSARTSASGSWHAWRSADGVVVTGTRPPFSQTTLPQTAKGPFCWHPTEDVLASASPEDGVLLWHARTGDTESVSTRKGIRWLDWLPDGSGLAGLVSSTWVFAMRKRDGAWTVTDHGRGGGTPQTWALSPNGRHYATDTRELEVQVVDLDTKDLQHRLMGHTQRPSATGWSRDGSRLATADPTGSLRIWDSETGEQLMELQLQGPVSALAWHPDDRRLAAIVGRRVRLLDAR